MRHAYKLKRHSLAISSVRCIYESAELLLAGPVSLILKDCHRKTESAHFLIPPPPIGPPLAAKSQLSIPPHRIPIFIPSDPDRSSYLSWRKEDIPVFFKASSSAFSFFLINQLNYGDKRQVIDILSLLECDIIIIPTCQSDSRVGSGRPTPLSSPSWVPVGWNGIAVMFVMDNLEDREDVLFISVVIWRQQESDQLPS